jgi:hypothetical protein
LFQTRVSLTVTRSFKIPRILKLTRRPKTQHYYNRFCAAKQGPALPHEKCNMRVLLPKRINAKSVAHVSIIEIMLTLGGEKCGIVRQTHLPLDKFSVLRYGLQVIFIV